MGGGVMELYVTLCCPRVMIFCSVEVKTDKKLLTVFFPDGRDGRAFTLKVLLCVCYLLRIESAYILYIELFYNFYCCHKCFCDLLLVDLSSNYCCGCS